MKKLNLMENEFLVSNFNMTSIASSLDDFEVEVNNTMGAQGRGILVCVGGGGQGESQDSLNSA